MPTISTSTTITLPAGQKLVISGAGATATATVNPGSLAQIYDVGIGQDILGPFDRATPVRVEIRSGSVTYNTLAEGAAAVLDNGGALTLPDGTKSPAGGMLAAAINSICESYARSKDRNPRVNPTIRSCELVSDTIYADSAALQTAFPAASNNNKGGKVGTAGAYVIQVSDGASWATPAAGVMGYLLTGVSTTGYATAVSFVPAGLTTTAPDNGGVQQLKPARLYGAMPWANNGLQGLSYFNTSGTRQQSPTARLRVSTDEAEPIVRVIGSTSGYIANIDLGDGLGFRSIVNPAISTNTGSPNYLTNQAFTGPSGGGLGNVKLDLSQLGTFGRRARTLEFQVIQDATYNQIQIKPVSSFFQPSESQKILLVTDSLGGTVYLGNMKDAYSAVVQDVMGVPDVCVISEGGTGFVNTNGANRNHLAKLQNLTQIPQYANPDVIVLQSSANDNNLSGISDAVETCLTYALATWPKAVIVVTGPTSRNSVSEQNNSIATENLVKAGFDRVTSSRLLWVPMMTDTPQFIRGTGAVNALASDGNADLMFNTGDTIHWVTPGHLIAGRDYFAPKIVAALRAWVEAQA